MEGRDDIVQQNSAPHQRTTNDTRQRNVHIAGGLNFNPDEAIERVLDEQRPF